MREKCTCAYACIYEMALTTHHLTSTDTFSHPTNVSYDVRSTDQYQPSLLLTVEDGVDLGTMLGKGYVVGYKGCSSDPTKVCYIINKIGVSCYIHVHWCM